MPVLVMKVDGTKQLFDREKVVRTCLRMGATREVAEAVAEKIETKVYDGIETRRILQMIFRELGRYKPEVKYQIDLRRALSLMEPKPDFERFVQILLGENGYEVTPNQIIRGRCVEHEVDAIARKDGETYIVEVKHHYNYHTPTGLDVSRIARAVLEDLIEGFELGLNTLKIDKAMIVCNTKLSEHAKRYAECRGIHHIGWNSPPDQDLRSMIERKRLYPITCLRGLKKDVREKLASAGIILLKELTKKKPEELRRETNLPRETTENLIEKAKAILSQKNRIYEA